MEHNACDLPCDVEVRFYYHVLVCGETLFYERAFRELVFLLKFFFPSLLVCVCVCAQTAVLANKAGAGNLMKRKIFKIVVHKVC